MLHGVIGVLDRVLGVANRIGAVLHRVLGMAHRIGGVLQTVLGVVHRVVGGGGGGRVGTDLMSEKC